MVISSTATELLRPKRMPKIILGSERRLADRIIRNLPKQSEIAKELRISQQLVSYRIKNVYPEQLADLIRICNLAGYEVRERD